MRYLLKTLLLAVTIIALTNCTDIENSRGESRSNYNSIYYWKTTFKVDSTDIAFLQKHDINRIYLRMFDVATEQNYATGKPDIAPIATTKFVSAVPKNIDIVPVTYITTDALRAMAGKEAEYATLIVERLLAMASYNECGNISEVQLDCDWTKATKESYNKLCKIVKDTLNSKDIALSITVRLHQLQETAPCADRGVLMLYNTGALKNPDTRNSILDIDDVKPYIKSKKYPLPLSYAFPVFGWGVKFKNNKFVSIIPTNSSDSCAVSRSGNEHIRYERPAAAEILAVKKLVEKNLGKPANGNILFHLDNSQLKNYTNDEISQILIN